MKCRNCGSRDLEEYDLTHFQCVDCEWIQLKPEYMKSRVSGQIECEACSKAGGAGMPVYHLPPECKSKEKEGIKNGRID